MNLKKNKFYFQPLVVFIYLLLSITGFSVSGKDLYRAQMLANTANSGENLAPALSGTNTANSGENFALALPGTNTANSGENFALALPGTNTANSGENFALALPGTNTANSGENFALALPVINTADSGESFALALPGTNTANSGENFAPALPGNNTADSGENFAPALPGNNTADSGENFAPALPGINTADSGESFAPTLPDADNVNLEKQVAPIPQQIKTPLMSAAEEGNFHMVQQFCENGADNTEFIKAFILANKNSHKQIENFLLEKIAPTNQSARILLAIRDVNMDLKTAKTLLDDLTKDKDSSNSSTLFLIALKEVCEKIYHEIYTSRNLNPKLYLLAKYRLLRIIRITNALQNVDK